MPWEFLELILPFGLAWRGKTCTIAYHCPPSNSLLMCYLTGDKSHWAAVSETNRLPETSPSSAEQAHGFLSIYISANAPRLILSTDLLQTAWKVWLNEATWTPWSASTGHERCHHKLRKSQRANKAKQAVEDDYEVGRGSPAPLL